MSGPHPEPSPQKAPTLPSPASGGGKNAQAGDRTAWRPIVIQAAGMWLVTRLVFAAVTYATVILNSPNTSRTPPGFVNGQWDLGTFLGVWQRWDAGWYVEIARNGYSSPESAAFLPLYPMLIHAVSVVTGSGFLILDAIIISNLATLVGFIGIALLAARENGPGAAPAAVRALAAYPLAFFTAAPYTEGLFLAAAAFALYWARQGAWWLTAVAAFVAGLTRSNAAILVLPIAWEYGRQQGWWRAPTLTLSRERGREEKDPRNWGMEILRGVVAIGAMPLAIALYAAYLWNRFGQPLLFAKEESVFWNRQVEPVWLTLRHAAGHLLRNPFGTYWHLLIVIDLGAVVVFGILAVVGARQQPFAFTLYMAGLLLVSLAAPILVLPDPLTSVARYMVVAIPSYLLLGRWMWRWPAFDLLAVGAGFMLQAALLTYFLSGGWVE